MQNIIGQIVGFIAVLLTIVSYQVKTNKELLIVQTVSAVLFSLHYFLIGALSAFVLNIIAAIRNIVYCNKDKFFLSNFCPYLFALIMIIMGFFAWQGLYSIFLMAGLAINTVCLSLSDSQNIRKSILISSPLVLIYDIFVMSMGGLANEILAITSSVVGIVRYHNKK